MNAFVYGKEDSKQKKGTRMFPITIQPGEVRTLVTLPTDSIAYHTVAIAAPTKQFFPQKISDYTLQVYL